MRSAARNEEAIYKPPMQFCAPAHRKRAQRVTRTCALLVEQQGIAFAPALRRSRYSRRLKPCRAYVCAFSIYLNSLPYGPIGSGTDETLQNFFCRKIARTDSLHDPRTPFSDRFPGPRRRRTRPVRVLSARYLSSIREEANPLGASTAPEWLYKKPYCGAGGQAPVNQALAKPLRAIQKTLDFRIASA